MTDIIDKLEWKHCCYNYETIFPVYFTHLKKVILIIAYLIILEPFQMHLSIISYIIIISLLLLLHLKTITVFPIPF